MNVHVRALARELARAGIASDLFTRATAPEQPAVVEVEPGVRVVHLEAGPLAPIPKHVLPRYLCAFLCSLLRAGERLGPYDLLHSHYWVSGWVARLARERWDAPVAHSFHTLGRVKNLRLAPGEEPEPPARLAGEERVVAAADLLVAGTPTEARELVELYGAAPARVQIVPHGVDLRRFRPGDRDAARAELGLTRRHVLAFAGRLQPAKAPDVAVAATAELARHRPDLDVELVVVGGPSGNGAVEPARLRRLAHDRGIADRVHFLPPLPHPPDSSGGELAPPRRPPQHLNRGQPLGIPDGHRAPGSPSADPRGIPDGRRTSDRAEGAPTAPPNLTGAGPTLATVYQAADLLLVPSRTESFGLVALEAQASGTPVVGARDGGLAHAVGDGTTGMLVDGHDPRDWAAAAAALLSAPRKRAAMGAAAARFAGRHGWDTTAAMLLGAYAGLLDEDGGAEALERTS